VWKDRTQKSGLELAVSVAKSCERQSLKHFAVRLRIIGGIFGAVIILIIVASFLSSRRIFPETLEGRDQKQDRPSARAEKEIPLKAKEVLDSLATSKKRSQSTGSFSSANSAIVEEENTRLKIFDEL
jgi:hypothetical protein